MGQPGAVMITLVIDKDLRLMRQPAKRSGVNDAISVALKYRPHRMFRFRMEASACLLRLRRIGRERSDHPSNVAATGQRVHSKAQSRGMRGGLAVHSRLWAAYEGQRFDPTIPGLLRLQRDPFDRMMIAQALAEGILIATSDRVFATCGVQVIW